MILLAALGADCPITALRWQEDCRPLAMAPRSTSDRRRESGLSEKPREAGATSSAHTGARRWRPLRYVPLDRSGRHWLTLGGEYRARVEAIDRPTYGVTPARGYVALDERFLVHADLRSESGARLFVQLAAALSNGRHQLRSFDRSAPDLQQAFVDFPLGRPDFLLRVGRQEFDGDGNRLLAIRDAANLRRAFDMVQLDLTTRADRISIFYGSPVLNGHGEFDDRRVRGETMLGLIARKGWGRGNLRGSAGVFAIDRSRPLAVYQDARGLERRQTLGLRVTVDAPRYTANLTAAIQRGKIAASSIHAAGFAGEFFYKLRLSSLPVRFGASFGLASGDRRPNDRRLGTFDVIYPNLGYFTDAPIVYPGNTWDIQPQAIVRATGHLEVGGGVEIVSRLTGRDATYQSGVPRLAPDGRSDRLLGVLPTLKMTWTPTGHLTVVAAAVHAFAGTVPAAAGARAVNFGVLQMSARY